MARKIEIKTNVSTPRMWLLVHRICPHKTRFCSIVTLVDLKCGSLPSSWVGVLRNLGSMVIYGSFWCHHINLLKTLRLQIG